MILVTGVRDGGDFEKVAEAFRTLIQNLANRKPMNQVALQQEIEIVHKVVILFSLISQKRTCI